MLDCWTGSHFVTLFANMHVQCSDECLYNTDKQLFKRLRTYCRNPAALRAKQFNVSRFGSIQVAECTFRFVHSVNTNLIM